MFFKSHKVLKLSAILIFIFPVIFAILLFSESDPVNDKVNCEIQQNSCTQSIAGTNIVLDISPKPVKAMLDLTFQVKIEGSLDKQTPYIDLGMPGMNMGKNRVDLEAVNQGIFEGVGVIVRCPSGITVWRATVTIPGSGSTDFIFDVVY